MYNALIIGCGKIAGAYEKMPPEWAYSHAGAYSRTGTIAVSCCADTEKQKAEALAVKIGSAVWTDGISEALERFRPDVVSVCTPDATHFSVTSQILQSPCCPKVIFLEKPACSTLDEFRQLAEISGRQGTKIVVNHSRRFDSWHRDIRKMIAEDTFGTLVRADVYYYGGWKHNGVHVVDTLSYLFSDALSVRGIRRMAESRHDGDPTVDFDLQFQQSGADVFLNGICEESAYQLFEFDLKFSAGRIRIEDFGSVVRFEKKIRNEMEENVLIPFEYILPPRSSSPMQSAVNMIASYLASGDDSLLAGCCIQDIQTTVATIEEGVRYYENQA